MKNIIIISFLFPPFNQIGARRAYFFAKYLTLFGHKVTVITSELPKDFSKWNVETNKLKVIRLPIVNMNLIKSSKRNSRLLNLFNNLLSPLEAARRISVKDIDLNQISKPDFIIATGGPWHIFEVGVFFKKTYKNSKLIFDYRDAWTIYDKSVSIDSLNNFGKGIGKMKKVLMKVKEKKLLTYADAVISITDPILKNVIDNPINIKRLKSKVIYNGFDGLHLDKKTKKEKFLIVYPGTLRKEQEHKLFLDGYRLFLDNTDVDKDKVDCYFVGSYQPKLQKLLAPFKSFAYPNNINITELVDNNIALEYQRKASVLLNFGYTGKKGIMSGKIFEYLAVQENILIVSKSEDVMEELVRKTETGKIASTEDMICKVLLDWYYEYKANGNLKYNVNRKEISFYEIKNQVQILDNFLDKL